MRKKLIFAILLISSLLSSVMFFQINAAINEEIDYDIRLKYTSSPPILIENNIDFQNYPLTGDGSMSTPWIIQDFNITNVGGYGISISGVSDYFEIRDCYILADDPIILNNVLSPVSTVINNTLENVLIDGDGIYINDTDNVFIQENDFYRCINGIYIEDANNLKIENNYFFENLYTIQGFHFTSSSIEFNTFDNNQELKIENSDTLDFFNNTFSYNENGLRLEDADNCNIIGNVFIDNWDYAIEFLMGSSGIVYNNYFIRNGLFYVSQVYDDTHTVDTEWYFGTVGNFWYDLGEKIVYPIDGGNNYYDLYPIYNSDSDELNDYEEEKIYLTDRFDEDTDDDMMWDDYEVENNLDPNLDDALDDVDSDLLANLDEMYHGTDPWEIDSDHDTLSDWYEVIWGLNPLTPNTDVDSDGDGLLDLEEALLGTLPNNDDSDSDGMKDKWEIDNSLDPLTNDAYADPDDDLLNNYLEFIYDCNPNLNDTDGDAHIDGWEIVHATDPNDPSDYPSESFETAIAESPISFVYVILSLIAISCLFVFRRKKI